ncbi:hypothetical protein BT69DRAFT_1292912 [Atractiella rhizophila]|nr:hypothetical protein BT69DRAFT_1292912 [Atractiella rhizophila]
MAELPANRATVNIQMKCLVLRREEVEFVDRLQSLSSSDFQERLRCLLLLLQSLSSSESQEYLRCLLSLFHPLLGSQQSTLLPNADWMEAEEDSSQELLTPLHTSFIGKKKEQPEQRYLLLKRSLVKYGGGLEEVWTKWIDASSRVSTKEVLNGAKEEEPRRIDILEAIQHAVICMTCGQILVSLKFAALAFSVGPGVWPDLTDILVVCSEELTGMCIIACQLVVYWIWIRGLLTHSRKDHGEAGTSQEVDEEGQNDTCLPKKVLTMDKVVKRKETVKNPNHMVLALGKHAQFCFDHHALGL